METDPVTSTSASVALVSESTRRRFPVTATTGSGAEGPGNSKGLPVKGTKVGAPVVGLASVASGAGDADRVAGGAGDRGRNDRRLEVASLVDGAEGVVEVGAAVGGLK
jgi:hypothetical protein